MKINVEFTVQEINLTMWLTAIVTTLLIVLAVT